MTYEYIKNIYDNEYMAQHTGVHALNKKYPFDVYYWFRKYGFALRNNQEKNRKYTCDSDYFECINSESKAYWLGFLYADGCVKDSTKTTKMLTISLAACDANHLEKLRQDINATQPINFYRTTGGYKVDAPYCRLSVQNDKLSRDLIRHGCVEHKTDIITPPINMRSDLIRHFIRGYLDGDGSITICKTKDGVLYKIRFTGTDDLLNWIMDYLIEQKIIQRKYPLTKRHDGQSVSNIEFGGELAVSKVFGFHLSRCYYMA